MNIKDAKDGKKNFLNCKTVWEIFLSHDLAEAETGRDIDPPSLQNTIIHIYYLMDGELKFVKLPWSSQWKMTVNF